MDDEWTAQNVAGIVVTVVGFLTVWVKLSSASKARKVEAQEKKDEREAIAKEKEAERLAVAAQREFERQMAIEEALRRRQWEIEDREYKARIEKASLLAAQVAQSEARKATAVVTSKIEDSMRLRHAENSALMNAVGENTMLTLETKVAANEAIVAANNVTEKHSQTLALVDKALKQLPNLPIDPGEPSMPDGN